MVTGTGLENFGCFSSGTGCHCIGVAHVLPGECLFRASWDLDAPEAAECFHTVTSLLPLCKHSIN